MTGLRLNDRVYDGRFSGYPALRFGSAPLETAACQVVSQIGREIPHLGAAEKLFNRFGNWTFEVRRAGHSMEDIAGRGLNIVGISLPQGLLAVMTGLRPWERNGQNIISTVLGIGMVMLFKNDKFGFNTLLDKFMKPQDTTLGGGFLKRLMNKARMPIDYFHLLKAAGVEFAEEDRKKAFWATLDGNQRTLVDGFYNKLQNKAKQGILTEAEKPLLKALPAFRRRLVAFPFLSTSLIALATIYVMGYLTTWFVFKFLVPLDQAKAGSGKPQPVVKSSGAYTPTVGGALMATPPRMSMPSSLQVNRPLPRISMMQPKAFQQFGGDRVNTRAAVLFGGEGQR